MARQGRGFDRDIRQTREPADIGELDECKVAARVNAEREVIDDEPETGMPGGDLLDLTYRRWRVHHDGRARALGLRPEPVSRPVEQPLAMFFQVKRQTDAEHPLLTLPSGDEPATFRLMDRQASHRGKSIGVPPGGLQHEIVVVAFPRRWNEHGAIDARLIHRREDHFLCDRVGLLRVLPPAWRPWSFRRICAPAVHLRIDDEHVLPDVLSLTSPTITSPRIES